VESRGSVLGAILVEVGVLGVRVGGSLPGHGVDLDVRVLGGGGGRSASCLFHHQHISLRSPTDTTPTKKSFHTEVVSGNTEDTGHNGSENLSSRRLVNIVQFHIGLGFDG
jgi:hypothetical protein